MYRTNNWSWKLTHVLCILGHLGLVAGASIAYVYNASKDRRTLGWADMAGFEMGRATPCNHGHGLVVARNWQYATPEALDAAALQTLPMSAMALGGLGLVLNIGLFVVLLGAETSKPRLTEGEQHWRKQIITFFGCAANLILAVAGVSLAAAMGVRISDSKSLITPLVCIALQAPLALATAVFDAVKNHRDGKDLLD
ncbi:hypothetical protein QBC39DRAFT_393272 [Podospora conica]|nr:hypothetical protein QBC39DRAFT_393272 [Schizothecium conicum]